MSIGARTRSLTLAISNPPRVRSMLSNPRRTSSSPPSMATRMFMEVLTVLWGGIARRCALDVPPDRRRHHRSGPVDFRHFDLPRSVDWVANSTPKGERSEASIPPRGIVGCMSEQHGHLEGNDEAVQAPLKRLRRIEGQVRGIQRMVEEEKYCIDILTQVSAATKALQALALSLLDDHMAHCLVDAARQGGAEQEQKLKEASEAIARLVKS